MISDKLAIKHLRAAVSTEIYPLNVYLYNFNLYF